MARGKKKSDKKPIEQYEQVVKGLLLKWNFEGNCIAQQQEVGERENRA
jgi:hypothetical protein